MGKAKYTMIGGFLGAGKTTAVLNIARKLRERGLRVGLITNDQSFGLVDTTMLASHGFEVEEITGGCFCCKFNSLVEASEKLSEESRPDVFIAEPVGSCTDLKATVDYPLRRIYGEAFEISPLSVMVDPVRAMRILGMESGGTFSAKVVYIYQKQLEEAEIIVINKIDVLPAGKLEALKAELARRFPKAQVIAVSAREGVGLEEWIEQLTAKGARTSGAMEVDYDVYADGEALLGWLNCTVNVEGEGIDGNGLLKGLAKAIAGKLKEKGMEVAHLKMTLSPEEGNDLGVINLVRNDVEAELSHRLAEEIEGGQLIVNLRAEGEPEVLRGIVIECVEQLGRGVKGQVEHIEAFRPGRPNPTHRMVGATGME